MIIIFYVLILIIVLLLLFVFSLVIFVANLREDSVIVIGQAYGGGTGEAWPIGRRHLERGPRPA